MSETIEDLKNMFVTNVGKIIVVDLSGCRLNHCKQMVLWVIVRLQANPHNKANTKSVKVKVLDSDQRSFNVPLNIDGQSLEASISSDTVVMKLSQM